MISSMTGGYSDAGPVNAIIAEFCEEHDLPFGVGSQRAMLVDETQIESFAVARKKPRMLLSPVILVERSLLAD